MEPLITTNYHRQSNRVEIKCQRGLRYLTAVDVLYLLSIHVLFGDLFTFLIAFHTLTIDSNLQLVINLTLRI